jgi:ABC-type molybdenum transport system ATPase subunit/photorepair protein PhrA
MFASLGQHEPAHLSLEVGTNVLYGLNGSGKTRTLTMLKAAFGIGPVSGDPGAFVNIQIGAPETPYSDISEDVGMCSFLDETSDLLFEMCERRIEPMDAEGYADLADFDPGGRLFSSTSIAGAVAVLLVDAGLPREIAVTIGQAGRFLIRPRQEGGADIYIGLPADAAELAALWQAGTKYYKVIAEQTDLSTGTSYNTYQSRLNEYDWIADELPHDWQASVAQFSTVNDVPGSFALHALLLVLGHLQRWEPLPPWAAVPVHKLGAIYSDAAEMRWDFGVVTDPEADAELACARVEDEILRVAVDRLQDDSSPLLTAAAGRVKVHETASNALTTVSAAATELLREVLGPSAPELVVELDPEQAVRTGRAVRLWALDEASGRALNVRDLSEAYRKWSLITLRLAHARTNVFAPPANLLLLDEPDGSLHILARRALSSGLVNVVEHLGLTAFVTTHSPDMVDNPSVRLWHTTRAAGQVSLSRFQAADFQERDPAAIGLRRSDVLLMTRAWLVVEGDHDEAVIDAWVGDELRKNLVRLIRMRGTHNALSILDSQLVFEATDARVYVVTDRTRASVVESFNKLLAFATDAASDRGDIFRRLHAVIPQERRDSEEGKLLELALAAVRAGEAHRLTFAGLAKADIIEYLPADAFVPGESWESLVRQRKTTDRRLPFKRWLAKIKGADVRTKALRAAVDQADHVPADVLALLHEVCPRSF